MSYLDQILGGDHEAALEEACAEDFVKSASAENIDLSQFTEDQVLQAYQAFRNDWHQKVAEQDTSTSLIEKAAAEGASDEMLEQLALAKLSGEAMCEGFLGHLAKTAQEEESADEEESDMSEDEAKEILEQATTEAVEAVTESAPEAAPEEIAEAAAEILPEVVAEKTAKLARRKAGKAGKALKAVRASRASKASKAVRALKASKAVKAVKEVKKPGRWAITSKLGPAVNRLSGFVSRHRLPLGIAGGLAAAGAGTALALRHRAKRKQAADLLFEGMDNMAKQASSDTPALEILYQLIG